MKRNLYALYLLSFIIGAFGDATAQEYRPQKNSLGFNFGALGYSGRFAVGSSLADHTSLYASFAYRRKVWDKLYLRAEAFGGRMRADNSHVASQQSKPNGWFQTEMAEISARAEYDFMDIRNQKFTPFVNVGAGLYTLFNYRSSLGSKSSSDRLGFVMPVGIGVKYRLNNRVKLLAEGNGRVFNKNLDNRVGETISNPNYFYSFGFGVIYELEPFNVLW